MRLCRCHTRNYLMMLMMLIMMCCLVLVEHVFVLTV